MLNFDEALLIGCLFWPLGGACVAVVAEWLGPRFASYLIAEVYSFLLLVGKLYTLLLQGFLAVFGLLLAGLLIWDKSTFCLGYTLMVGLLCIMVVFEYVVGFYAPALDLGVGSVYQKFCQLSLWVIQLVIIFFIILTLLSGGTALNAGTTQTTMVTFDAEGQGQVKPLKAPFAVDGQGPIKSLKAPVVGDALKSKPLPTANGLSWGEWFWSWFGYGKPASSSSSSFAAMSQMSPTMKAKPSVVLSALNQEVPLSGLSWGDWFWSLFGYVQPSIASPAGSLLNSGADLPVSHVLRENPFGYDPGGSDVSSDTDSDSALSQAQPNFFGRWTSLVANVPGVSLSYMGSETCFLLGSEKTDNSSCGVLSFNNFADCEFNELLLMDQPVTDYAEFAKLLKASPHYVVGDHLTPEQQWEVKLVYNYYLGLAINQPDMFMLVSNIYVLWDPEAAISSLIENVQHNLETLGADQPHPIQCGLT